MAPSVNYCCCRYILCFRHTEIPRGLCIWRCKTVSNLRKMALFLGEKGRVHLAMVLVCISSAGYTLIVKRAFNGGLNPYVFAVYKEGIAASILLTLAFLMERKKRLDPCSSYANIIVLCFAGSFTGIFAFNQLQLIGLQMSSAQLASTVGVTVPVFALLVAAIFRVEEINITRVDGIAKIGGVVLCVGGAAIVTLYKGPSFPFKKMNHVPLTLTGNGIPVLGHSFFPHLETWQIGCLLVLGGCICMALYLNVQRPLLRKFMAPLTVTAISHVMGEVMLIISSCVAVKDYSDWKLKNWTEIVAIMYAGMIGSTVIYPLMSWSSYEGGPILVSCYGPLPNLLILLTGAIFLGETLHLASILGAIIIPMGLYLIIWGQKYEVICHTKNDLQQPLHDQMHDNT